MASVPEAEWDDTEQAYMLALAAYRKRICPGCGGDLAETTAAVNEDRYKPELPLQCHRCLGFARAAETYQEEKHPHTYLHRVKLKRG